MSASGPRIPAAAPVLALAATAMALALALAPVAIPALASMAIGSAPAAAIALPPGGGHPDDPAAKEALAPLPRARDRVAPRRLAPRPLARDDRGFDAQDLRLAIDIDFDSRTIEASARHRFLATAPLDTLVLDLTDSLAVDAVLRSDRPLAFSHAGGLLSIALAPPLSPGDTGSVTVLYHGRPPRTALLGFAFETRDDGSPGAYTLSEPDGASSWWPCKDVPSDKMTATIDLTVPDTLWAGSNGRLVSDEVAAGRRRQVWRESHPIAPYLVSIACTNYARFGGTFVSQDGIEMPLLFLAWPEDSADAAASWGRTAAMLAAFEDRFGPYPFLSEKYGMAEFSWGGAMEHQTLSSMGAYSIDGTDGNDWIVAHEMAHQWWGDDVTCADFDHIWLNEGFARYAEAIWFESQGGIEAYRDWMRRMWRPSFPGAIVPPDYLFNSTVYLKGAWVLHMLRGILGDEAFFDVLSLYRSRHSGGAATTEDLIRAAETVAGRSLRWFFDPWIYGTGRPAYLTSWTTDPGPEGTAIELTIEQTQPEPPFRMPIEVEIEDALGSYRVRVDDSLRVQTFRIAIRMPVEGTRLDPDDWILKDGIGGSSVADLDGLPWIQNPIRPPRPSPGRPPFRIELAPPLRGAVLELFDPSGRRIAVLPAAREGVTAWDGRDASGREAAAGLYFLRSRPSPERPAATRSLIVLR